MLLRGDTIEITQSLKSMEQERKSLEKDIGTVVFHMNGGLDFTNAYNLSLDQINLLTDIIKRHYEQQKEAFRSKGQ